MGAGEGIVWWCGWQGMVLSGVARVWCRGGYCLVLPGCGANPHLAAGPGPSDH